MISKFNIEGHAILDFSTGAANFATVRNGTPRVTHGTSACFPVLVSIITLINGGRLDIGKKPIKSLNPALYVSPHITNDVVSGSSRGLVSKASALLLAGTQ